MDLQRCLEWAVRATARNADRNEVWVRLSTDREGRAVIKIRDSGSGIRPADLQKIFEPFFTTKAAGSGTGLGLSICHGIVKSLGGDISVASELGSGTTFTVVLPPVSKEPTESQVEETEKAVALRGRILLIDDESALLRAMQSILDDEHFVR